MLPNHIPCIDFASSLCQRSGLSDDLLHLVSCKKVGNFTCVEDVVDVFQERLLHDLSVREEESEPLALAQHCHHHALQVFSEVIHTVRACDLNRAAGEISKVCCHACDALSTNSADSDQQSIASRLSNDSGSSSKMALSILEEDEVHLAGVHAVVLLQSLLEGKLSFLRVRGLDVRLFITIKEVAEHERLKPIHRPLLKQVRLDVLRESFVEP
mmetsp:Transcript_29418/g.53394  ORF Transcript_29418/g.53394 Transcript_29418/m.53394 type:complete len:213 (-) Transcript_29418:440-1078(-)